MTTTTKLIAVLCLHLLVRPLSAQSICNPPSAYETLDINNISTQISNGGDFFNSGYNYTPALGMPGTIYSAGLWMGGIGTGGNLKLAAMRHRLGNEYASGPLDAQTGTTSASNCIKWNRIFKTTQVRINAFLISLPTFVANPQLAIDQFPDIMGWPGRGNPHFWGTNEFSLPENRDLAPFIDTDQDGIYNPLNGDYPAVKLRDKAPFVPDQILWCVFNDVGVVHSLSGGTAIGMEAQLTSWAFKTQTGAPYNNTIFTSHKTSYFGSETLSDFHVGIWTDFDLGCHLDDYTGCAPLSNTFFAYNQDATDEDANTSCNGIPNFGSKTPVQTATFLNTSMDKFMSYNNSLFNQLDPVTTDPLTAIEHYHYLTGRWRDGKPLTIGGTGYNPTDSIPTDFAFPDDPADTTGWSMCSANLSFDDRRTIASHRIGDLTPGSVFELTTAWTIHPNTPAPCNLGNALESVAEIQDAYNNSFDGISGLFSPVTLLSAPVKAIPNPANDAVLLDYGQLNIAAIRCFDMQGRLIFSQNNPETGTQRIATSEWPVGNYTFQLVADNGIVNVRVAVVR